MAIYNRSGRTFTLEADEVNFTVPTTVPTPFPGQSEPTPDFLKVIGNALANTLMGHAEGSTLDGGAGADLLIGGQGDDHYIVDDLGDVVQELAGEGRDYIWASVSFVLSSNVEYLFLSGTADVNGTGNEFDNSIYGNSGNNVLSGGDGDDFFGWSQGMDRFEGGAGIDTLSFLGSRSIKVDLTAGKTSKGDTCIEIENVLGSSFSDTLIGNSSHNRLDGNTKADKIKGGHGNDTIIGGHGNDALSGGKGKDVFIFDLEPSRKLNFDKITDYTVKDDSIWLDNSIFRKIGKGTESAPSKLKNKFFKSGAGASDRDDFIIYNKSTGVLSYDPDGSGFKQAIELALLKKNLKMTHKDFFVI